YPSLRLPELAPIRRCLPASPRYLYESRPDPRCLERYEGHARCRIAYLQSSWHFRCIAAAPHVEPTALPHTVPLRPERYPTHRSARSPLRRVPARVPAPAYSDTTSHRHPDIQRIFP